MYEIMVETHLDAAHFLRGYRGKCEAMHGHRFRVAARVSAAALNDIGIAYDFADLKKDLNEAIAGLDHTCLNDHPAFQDMNPSSENLARLVYDRLEASLRGSGLKLGTVEVWESPFTAVVYRPD